MRKLLDAAFCLSLASMLVFGLLLGVSLERDRVRQVRWRELAASTEQDAVSQEGEAASPEQGAADENQSAGRDILPRFRALCARNPDIVGWLTMESAHIDCPVMQTVEDPEHYLRRNFDGEYDWYGTPFVDARCPMGPEPGFNTVLYGHDSLFTWLFQYSYTKGYYETHKTLRFDTLWEEAEYEVEAVLFADVTGARLLDPWDASDEQAYAFYNYLNADSPGGVRKFAAGLAEGQILDKDVEVTPDSRLLTLVCCVPAKLSDIPENGRFVIVAKRVER